MVQGWAICFEQDNFENSKGKKKQVSQFVNLEWDEVVTMSYRGSIAQKWQQNILIIILAHRFMEQGLRGPTQLETHRLKATLPNQFIGLPLNISQWRLVVI
jgi:hypothetical protein